MRKKARLKNSGFTLVEIVIVTAILGVIALLVVPNFISAGERAKGDICLDNTKQIYLAKKMWALENGDSDSGFVTMTELLNGQFLKSEPTCPTGGVYSIVADGGELVGTKTTCDIHGTESGDHVGGIESGDYVGGYGGGGSP